MVCDSSARFGRALLALPVFFLLAVTPVPARGVDCEITCNGTACGCSGSGDCVINSIEPTSTIPLPAGAVVDCSGRDIFLENIGMIWVRNGFFTLRAHNVTGNPAHHRLEAQRTSAGVPFGIILELSGTLNMNGTIWAQSDTGGGSVSVDAAGDINILDSSNGEGILASATAPPGGPGGKIILDSDGKIDIYDPLRADASSLGAGGFGGEIAITANGQVTIYDTVSALGRDDDGGTVSFVSNEDDVEINASVTVDGADQDGNGGLISATAHYIKVNGPLSAQGGKNVGGGQGMGGTIRLDAGDGGLAITAAGDIDVTGGAAGSGLDGGAIVIDSDGNASVANGAELLTKSDANGGDGGDIAITSAKALTISNGAVLDASGHYTAANEGNGANVELAACNLDVQSGAQVRSLGHAGGSIRFTGRETLNVNATVNASGDVSHGGQEGSIALYYRLPGRCLSESPLRACETATCLSPGFCSHDASVSCTSSANCNNGCGTFPCLHKCSNNQGVLCAADNQCTGCKVGSCTGNQNPVVGSGFTPSGPSVVQVRSLAACD